MTVGYYGDESFEEQISKSIRNMIERGSNEDWFITDDEISKIVYAEESTAGVAVERLGIRKGGSLNLSNAGISIIIAAAVATIIGIAFLAKRTRRKRKEHVFVLTPSPKAGKKSGLQSQDSECIRIELNDKRFKNIPGIDPFETEPKIEDPPTNVSQSDLDMHQGPTFLITAKSHLSTITEGSRETSSHGNRLLVITSPMGKMNRSFSRILSESTHGDGVHSLGRSVDGLSDSAEPMRNYQPKFTYEERRLPSSSPQRCEF